MILILPQDFLSQSIKMICYGNCFTKDDRKESYRREEGFEDFTMTGNLKGSLPLNSLHQEKRKTDILDLVGGDGRWQRRVFLIMMVAIIPGAFHNLSMSFLAPNIDHWCARPPESANISLDTWRTFGLPSDDQQCHRYENFSLSLILYESSIDFVNESRIPCRSWDYDDSFYKSTVLSEWNLVCDREWLVSLSKSMFMAGVLVGVSVFGCVSDRLGRRPTIAACCFITVSAATICAFSTSFAMFITSRFFLAMGIGGYYTTFFVLLMEITGPKIRSVYGMAVQFGWCIGFVSLPGIAWLIRDWFWIQVALTAPCIAFLAIWWVIPESPRWLLSQGRIKEARKALQHAAKSNKIDISDLESTMSRLIYEATEKHESEESKGNVLHLLTTPGLRSITLNVYLLWFVNAFVYYGISFNTNELAGDPFLNFALSGAVEFPAYFLAIFALKYWGRRRPLAATMITAGMSCLLAYFLPEDPAWLTVVVSNIGKFCITASFGIVYIFTTELFPTVVRNAGLGSASLCEGIGSIIAPFTRELGIATHPAVPFIVIGLQACVSGVLVLFLPETHNQVVPGTFKEAAEASRRKKGKVLQSVDRTVDLKVFSNASLETEESRPVDLPSYKDTVLFEPPVVQQPITIVQSCSTKEAV